MSHLLEAPEAGLEADAEHIIESLGMEYTVAHVSAIRRQLNVLVIAGHCLAAT